MNSTGLHFDDLQFLCNDRFLEVNVAGKEAAGEILSGCGRARAYIARLSEATSKYQRFIATKSFMLNRVPLKFIASTWA